MTLPAGSSLPVDIRAESLTELLRVAELSVFIQDYHLVYVIEIPLVLNAEYNVYRPIQLNSDTLVLISPDVDYLAISADNEKFLTFTTENWRKCKTLQTGKLCNRNEPTHLRLDSQLCEVSLLTSHQTLSNTCNLKVIKSYKPIWHTLSETNSRLYATPPNSGIITCSHIAETFKIELAGIGRLTLSHRCELHIDHSVFTPLHQNVQNIKMDIISRDEINETLPLLAEMLKDVVPQNITGMYAIKDFIKL
uniref:Envelope fusion protein n=2 Tax=Sipha flava TaxID=143950 RepID=A0A2S2QW77_9HEMI